MLIIDDDNGTGIEFPIDVIPIKNGGTSGRTVEEARINLGIVSSPATLFTDGLMSAADKRNLDALIKGQTSIKPATPDSDGLFSAEDKRKLDSLSSDVATHESPGLMSPEDKLKLDNLSDLGVNLDYEYVYNKPSIEGTELEGDVLLSDIGIELATDEDIDGIF